jgi:hypothetical protein
VKLTYVIDGEEVVVDGPGSDHFSVGLEEVLAVKFEDIAQNARWYRDGYCVRKYAGAPEFLKLKSAVQELIRGRILQVFPEKDLSDFSLEKYHRFVSQAEHVEKIDRLVKRFFWDEINFDDKVFIEEVEQQIGKSLGYVPHGSKTPHWIIIRINMPGSNAYNPAHKDVYEGYDTHGVCPAMINAWVPICGVDKHAGLSIAPKSHLIPESEIWRTKAGSEMNGNSYFVNCIRSWSNSVNLTTLAPNCGEVLIFSSHLIHGLGRNQNTDTTRVALEFRLHTRDGMKLR